MNNETIHSLASSRNYTGNDAIDNVDNYVKEWWRVVKNIAKCLKPCPFCGGRAELKYTMNRALIECTNTKCKLQPSTWLHVDTDSVNKLVKIWNTRNYMEV